MNDSREKLARTGKPGAGAPSSNGRGIAERQNGGQADHHAILDATRGSEATVAADCYARIEADFRSHHETNAAGRRGPYEHYRLVYRYGYDLGADTRYRDAAWSAVEQAARPRWEERNPGTWELFKETIRYAWDTTRGQLGASC